MRNRQKRGKRDGYNRKREKELDEDREEIENENIENVWWGGIEI